MVQPKWFSIAEGRYERTAIQRRRETSASLSTWTHLRVQSSRRDTRPRSQLATGAHVNCTGSLRDTDRNTCDSQKPRKPECRMLEPSCSTLFLQTTVLQ